MPNFDIHEDRSITMAINTKKKQDIGNMSNLMQDKENAKYNAPIAAPTLHNVSNY